MTPLKFCLKCGKTKEEHDNVELHGRTIPLCRTESKKTISQGLEERITEFDKAKKIALDKWLGNNGLVSNETDFKAGANWAQKWLRENLEFSFNVTVDENDNDTYVCALSFKEFDRIFGNMFLKLPNIKETGESK